MIFIFSANPGFPRHRSPSSLSPEVESRSWSVSTTARLFLHLGLFLPCTSDIRPQLTLPLSVPTVNLYLPGPASFRLSGQSFVSAALSRLLLRPARNTSPYLTCFQSGERSLPGA